ncbi:MAG: sigma-70 family RNA polymerase sigma factor [Candidatus Eisenbacteria bacterium]
MDARNGIGSGAGRTADPGRPSRIAPRDAVLIERLRAGESKAWQEFIERYRRLMWSAIHRSNARYAAGWDESAMEDLFEESLLKLLRANGKALRSWKGRCKLETWIYRIVRNVCIDYLRRESRRSGPAAFEEERADGGREGELSGSAEASTADLRLSLEQAMESALDAREAVMVRLIYFEGFTYREVAERFGMTVGAMSGFVYRALAKLRESGRLERDWGGR